MGVNARTTDGPHFLDVDLSCELMMMASWRLCASSCFFFFFLSSHQTHASDVQAAICCVSFRSPHDTLPVTQRTLPPRKGELLLNGFIHFTHVVIARGRVPPERRFVISPVRDLCSPVVLGLGQYSKTWFVPLPLYLLHGRFNHTMPGHRQREPTNAALRNVLLKPNMHLLCPHGRRCPSLVGGRIKVLLAMVALLLSHHSTVVLLASGAEFDTPLTVRSFAPPATIANNIASVVPSAPPVVVTAAGDVYVAYYDYLTAPVRSAVAVYHANAPTAGGDLGPPPGVEVLLAEGSIVSSMASLAPPPPSLAAPTTNDVLVAVTQLAPDAPSGSFLAAVDGDAHPPVRWAVDRRNTTTLKNVLAVPNVALAVFLRPLVTSIDVAATTTAQELVAVNTTTGSVIWTRTFNFPSTTSAAEQQQSTLTYYTGYLYFFTGDILNRLHAATGTSMGTFNSPCNVSSTDHPISWFLGVSTFSYEANGNPLDAFIVYGNTSVDLFTMCRFSHNTGATEWVLSVVFPLNFMVDDICGGAGNLFLSGHAINASAPPGSATSVHYYTFVVNATSGHLVDFPYVRYAVDARSYPRLLPPVVNDNCVGDALGNNMMVQQIGGRTMAYCAAVPYLLQWISEVPCYHTPLIVTPPQAALPLAPLYGVACAAKVGTTTPSIAMLHADSGDVLWSTTFDVGAPMATDHVYVYAVDPHGVLTQFSVAPASSALGPHPAGGLTSGETALVVVLVLVAVGGGGFATMRSRCGAARRRRAVGATQHESAPGDGVGGAGSSVALNRQEYGTVVS